MTSKEPFLFEQQHQLLVSLRLSRHPQTWRNRTTDSKLSSEFACTAFGAATLCHLLPASAINTAGGQNQFLDDIVLYVPNPRRTAAHGRFKSDGLTVAFFVLTATNVPALEGPAISSAPKLQLDMGQRPASQCGSLRSSSGCSVADVYVNSQRVVGLCHGGFAELWDHDRRYQLRQDFEDGSCRARDTCALQGYVQMCMRSTLCSGDRHTTGIPTKSAEKQTNKLRILLYSNRAHVTVA